MKTTSKLAVGLMLCNLFAFNAGAFIVFQDNFNYPNGVLSNSTWVAGAGNNSIDTNGVLVNNDTVDITEISANSPRAYFTNGVAGYTYPTATSNFLHTVYYFGTNTPVAALYLTFQVNVSAATNSYFAGLLDTNFTIPFRIYASTNTATPGFYRLGVEASTTLAALTNGVGVATNIIQQDLSFNQSYTVVGRYIPSSGLETLWVNPISETNSASSVAAQYIYTAPWPNIAGFEFRSATGTSSESGVMDINSLVVGTTFADVVPTSVGSNPPFIVTQPQGNTNLFAGNNFTNTVLAGGDTPLYYQWYFTSNSVTTAISTATNATLPLTNLATNQSGNYFVVVTNAAGVVTSSVVNVLISPVPVPPTVSSPASAISVTNTVGDTVNLAVIASGIPSPSYRWFVITNNVTNAVAGSNIGGTNTSTLTITAVLTNQSGVYFCTVTNLAGKTNSPLITLVVNPIPFVTIAQLRSMVDPATYAPTNGTSLFTVEGIVTTWTNMTSSGSPEFYIQDATAGLAIFWSGAGGSNTPPAGALVQVTAPFEVPIFDGLLELEPVFGNALESVTIISTNNPLPTPQPLPFDSNIQNNYPVMQSLVGSYFVASNVFLDLADGPTISGGNNDPLTNIAYNVFSDENTADTYDYTFTNQAGQTFVIFYNTHTDIPNQVKPTGPVTIYGVLGQFVSSSPYTGGYEFTPSRYADIISYVHVTNVLSNVRPGDLTTNNYTELVVRPGEKLTTYVSIGDAAGGTVTLTPTGTLPTGASWTTSSPGLTATAVFKYTGNPADAGNQFTIQLNVTSTSGTAYTESFTVYVPTADEQKIAITEFLANPTTNTSAANFNPLHRSSDTGANTNDEYIELVNQSPDSLDTSSGQNGWSLYQGNTEVVGFDDFGSPPSISSSNAIVLYSGNSSQPPSLPVSSYTDGPLGLPTSGTGTIVLRDGDGYIVDRIVYSASNLNTNGSLTRFPSMNGPFVPQAYVSTNRDTPGLQYDGSTWNQPFKVPAGVTNIGVNGSNGQVIFNFTANTGLASTLWSADSVAGPYSVFFGEQFPTAAGSFTNTPSASQKFYYITTQ